jgi:hypothetical protein
MALSAFIDPTGRATSGNPVRVDLWGAADILEAPRDGRRNGPTKDIGAGTGLQGVLSMKRWILVAILGFALAGHPEVGKADWQRETIGGPSFGEHIEDIVARGQQVAAAKQAANAEIEEARRKFFADCVNGVRGKDAEKQFAEVLFAKDLYFLSLYASEGMTPAVLRHLDGIDNLTGGPFDGGIPPQPANEAFGAWVEKIRATLHAPPPGQLWLPTQGEFIHAIAVTSDDYARYRVLRDRAEFGRWHKSIRVNAPAAKTPVEFADGYIKYILTPDIDAAVANISESERAVALQKIAMWRGQPRQAIIDFESIEVTPDKLTAMLRQQKFSDDLVQMFIDAVDKARQSGNSNLNDIMPRAQQEIYVRWNRMTSGTHARIAPSVSNLEWGNRLFIYAEGAGNLTPGQRAEINAPAGSMVSIFDYLYGPGQPVKFPRDRYDVSRFYLRVRPGSFRCPGQPSQHESDGREQHICTGFSVEAFPVLGEATAPVKPRESSFDHPSFG